MSTRKYGSLSAGISAVALMTLLASCSAEPESEPDDTVNGGTETQEAGETTPETTEQSSEPAEDPSTSEADEEHVPVEESETEEPDPAALQLCELIRPDIPTRIFGQGFNEPQESEDGTSCSWESSATDGEEIVLTSEVTSAESWEALRRDLGVQIELTEFGDDAFIDDDSHAHLWFEDQAIHVNATIEGINESQIVEVVEEVSINLEDQR